MIKKLILSEIEILREFDLILDKEREILKSDEASKLPLIMDEKKKLALELSKLEKNRKELCGEKSAKELLNEGVIDEDIFNELSSLTLRVKEKNELNALLTKQALAYIKMYTSILSQGNKVVTYKGTGKIDETPNSMFNTTI